MIPSEPTFSSESDVDEFVRLFQTRALPKAQWNHHAHLVVGLWHVLQHPRGTAMDLLRTGIRIYNESIDVKNTPESGYHETWTAFFVQALAIYAETRQATHDRLALFNQLTASRLADKLLPLAFYSRERLMSPAVRLGYMEPDLRPLSGLQDLLDPARMAQNRYYLRGAGRPDAPYLLRLITALADFEKLPPPDAAAQKRLTEDAFGSKPRFEPWLAFAAGHCAPVGYAIFFETYSSFLAMPTLYIEDVFVMPDYRGHGIGGALLRKAIELAHERNCGRVEWTTLDWNVNAQRVYEDKIGAKRMSEWYLYRMTRREITSHLKQKG